jgi:hypothetical protein
MVGELVVREMVNADGQPSSRRITLRPKGSDLESAPFTLVLPVDQESEFRIFAVLEQGGKQDG